MRPQQKWLHVLTLPLAWAACFSWVERDGNQPAGLGKPDGLSGAKIFSCLLSPGTGNSDYDLIQNGAPRSWVNTNIKYQLCKSWEPRAITARRLKAQECLWPLSELPMATRWKSSAPADAQRSDWSNQIPNSVPFCLKTVLYIWMIQEEVV